MKHEFMISKAVFAGYKQSLQWRAVPKLHYFRSSDKASIDVPQRSRNDYASGP